MNIIDNVLFICLFEIYLLPRNWIKVEVNNIELCSEYPTKSYIFDTSYDLKLLWYSGLWVESTRHRAVNKYNF